MLIIDCHDRTQIRGNKRLLIVFLPAYHLSFFFCRSHLSGREHPGHLCRSRYYPCILRARDQSSSSHYHSSSSDYHHPSSGHYYSGSGDYYATSDDQSSSGDDSARGDECAADDCRYCSWEYSGGHLARF